MAMTEFNVIDLLRRRALMSRAPAARAVVGVATTRRVDDRVGHDSLRRRYVEALDWVDRRRAAG
jgi:hypothetical protein